MAFEAVRDEPIHGPDYPHYIGSEWHKPGQLQRPDVEDQQRSNISRHFAIKRQQLLDALLAVRLVLADKLGPLWNSLFKHAAQLPRRPEAGSRHR